MLIGRHLKALLVCVALIEAACGGGASKAVTTSGAGGGVSSGGSVAVGSATAGSTASGGASTSSGTIGGSGTSGATGAVTSNGSATSASTSGAQSTSGIGSGSATSSGSTGGSTSGMTCSAAGGFCQASPDCCASLTCDQAAGSCVSGCLAVGAACSSDADCCASAFCQVDTSGNGTCTATGTPCGMSSSCTPISCPGDEVCSVTSSGVCNAGTSDLGTCEPPSSEYAACSLRLGCGGGLTCLPNPVDGNCLQTCQTNADCSNPTESCQPLSGQNVCQPNDCGPQASPSSGPAYYQPCNSRGTNDGECLPVCSGVCDPQNQSTYVGHCVPPGPIAVGSPCDPSIDPIAQSVAGGSCVAGALCTPVGDAGVCQPLCDPFNQQLGCSAGTCNVSPDCASNFCFFGSCQ